MTARKSTHKNTIFAAWWYALESALAAPDPQPDNPPRARYARAKSLYVMGCTPLEAAAVITGAPL